jgi:hypothetical protein
MHAMLFSNPNNINAAAERCPFVPIHKLEGNENSST